MAISLKKINLKNVVAGNRYWPLIIGGAGASDLGGLVMPATISVRDLNTGKWVDELRVIAADQKNVVMAIDGMDTLTPRAQEKFIGLLKDRRAGTRKLPDNVQIVIPVKSVDAVAAQIQRLSLIYNV